MTLEDLGRRAVKCKHWRWLRGMKTLESGAAVPVPDLGDPCTIGGLLHLVREAYGLPNIRTADHRGPKPNGWWECGHLVENWVGLGSAKTEVGAMVAALEAAP
jgi:hypothetical protein